MKQIIPFIKEISFENNISSILSISLEHEEKINAGEVTGNFILSGEYKAHADTTEKTAFNHQLPFTTLIPENIILDSIQVDIDNFTYEVKDNKTLKVNIDYLLSGEEKEKVEEEITEEEMDRNIDAFLDQIDNTVMEVPEVLTPIKEMEIPIKKTTTETIKEEVKKEETKKTATSEKEEITVAAKETNDYVTYYIHIVSENETIEEIIKKYETNLENLKTYNDISNIKIGDKIVIPKYLDE